MSIVVDIYAITVIGITISLAGMPRINAIKITPSNPKRRAKGSRNRAHNASNELSPIKLFAISQMIRPAGIAATTALPSTNIVLSKTERISTLPICGILYGGSSRVKADGIPRRSVADSSLDTARVTAIAKRIKSVRMIEAGNVDLLFTKKIVITDTNRGNRPLHGIKLLVKVAIKRSRGESMILHPTTPAALQPSPIHIESTCFPQVLHL